METQDSILSITEVEAENLGVVTQADPVANYRTEQAKPSQTKQDRNEPIIRATGFRIIFLLTIWFSSFRYSFR